MRWGAPWREESTPGGDLGYVSDPNTTVLGEHTVLHNITDDAKLIEITAATFRTERLFESNLQD